jgi:hypothetical protein
MSLVQINSTNVGYRKFQMKDGSGEFLAKKSAGGNWYYIILNDGSRLRHTANVVERLAEPIPVEAK